VVGTAFPQYHPSLGAGLSALAVKVFRIGQIGDLNEFMVLGALSGVEMVVRDVGIDIELGVAAAASRFQKDRRRDPTWIESVEFASYRGTGFYVIAPSADAVASSHLSISKPGDAVHAAM
jgi:hypothetical protein